MLNKKRSSLLFGMTCMVGSVLLASTAMAATASPVVQSAVAQPMYPWKAESAKDKKTGAMLHCLVKNVYSNGTLLILAENHEGAQRLAVHFTEDKLEPGLLVDLTIQVDDKDVFPVEGMTTTPRILAINIPDMLPEQMRKGNVLRIRGPQDDIAYQLKGSDKAVRDLRDCVASNKNPAAAQAKVAELTSSAQPAPAPAATAAAPVIATAKQDSGKAIPVMQEADTKPAQAVAAPLPLATPSQAKTVAAAPAATTPSYRVARSGLPLAWDSVFSAAAIAPQQKMISAAHSGLVMPLDYAWHNAWSTNKDDTYRAGLRIGKALNKDALASTTKDYLFSLRKACKGTFIAEASEQAVTSNGLYTWQVAETICSDNGTERITAILATTDENESALFVIETDMTQAADAIRARNAVLETLSKK